MRDLVARFVEERDWTRYHSPKALAMAISIESAELLENFLFQPDDFLPAPLEKLTDEMADVFIYLMSMVNSLNLPSFADVVQKKMEKNQAKYPVEKYSGDRYEKV